jgi:WD40 repeat protein
VVRVWEVGSGREVRRMEHGDLVNGVSFSPDGRFLASGGEDGVVRVWDVGSGREVRRMEHGADVRSVSFSPDGRFLASGGGMVWFGCGRSGVGVR